MRLDGRPDVAGAVDREGVAERGPSSCGNRRAAPTRPALSPGRPPAASRPQLGMALALLAVMMGQQDPLHSPNADLTQMLQHAAVTHVDQHGRIAVAKDVHVAGVRPDEEIRPGPPPTGAASAAPKDSRRIETQNSTCTGHRTPRRRYRSHVHSPESQDKPDLPGILSETCAARPMSIVGYVSDTIV